MKIYQAGCGCVFSPLSEFRLGVGAVNSKTFEYIILDDCDFADGIGIRVETGRLAQRNLDSAEPVSVKQRATILEKLSELVLDGRKFQSLKRILA